MASLTFRYTDNTDNQIWLKGQKGYAGYTWSVNITGIPELATVDSATLSFSTGYTYSTPGSTAVYSGSSHVGTTELWRITGSGLGKTYSVNISNYVTGNGNIKLHFSRYYSGNYDSNSVYSHVFFAGVKIVVTYTDPYSKCKAPTTITITPATCVPEGTATLSWSGATAGKNMTISGYKIERSTDNGTSYSTLGTVSVSTTNGSYSVTGPATKNAKYIYRIQTLGSVSGYDSSFSTTTAILTCYYSAPSAPTATTYTYSVLPSDSVTLTWNAATQGTNNPITGYKIYKNGTVVVNKTTNRTYTVTAPATEGKKDTYTIYTLGTYEDDAKGRQFIVATLKMPNPITAIYLDQLIRPQGNTVAPLRWDPPANATDVPKTGYKIYTQTSTDKITWTSETLLTTITGCCYLANISSDTPGTYRRFLVSVIGAVAEQESEKAISPIVYTCAAFTDSDLQKNITPIKAVHMTELQNLSNTALDNVDMTRKTFTNIIANTTSLGGWTDHVNEIRAAIDSFNPAHEAWSSITINCPTVAVMDELREQLLYQHQKVFKLDISLLNQAILS